MPLVTIVLRDTSLGALLSSDLSLAERGILILGAPPCAPGEVDARQEIFNAGLDLAEFETLLLGLVAGIRNAHVEEVLEMLAAEDSDLGMLAAAGYDNRQDARTHLDRLRAVFACLPKSAATAPVAEPAGESTAQ